MHLIFNWFFFLKPRAFPLLKVSPYEEISDKHLYSNNIFYLGYFISVILPVGNLDTQYLFADVFYFHLIPSIISLSDNPSKTKKQYQFEYCVREYLIAPLYICSRSHTLSNGQGRFDRERKNLKEKFKKNILFFFYLDKYFSPSNLAALYQFCLPVLTY